MTTPSPRLKLKVPSQPDRFSTQDLIDNLNILDGKPGLHICTSTTRPGMVGGPAAWAAAQAGMNIFETNTGLQWNWTGSAWRRTTGGQGVLKRTDSSYAVAERTTDFSTGSTDPRIVVGLTNVVVPDGRRSLMLVAAWKDAGNATNGDHFPGWIFRSNTANTGPIVGSWLIGTIGGSMTMFIRDGLPAGTYDFSFQASAPTGTTTISGSAPTPISLACIEL